MKCRGFRIPVLAAGFITLLGLLAAVIHAQGIEADRDRVIEESDIYKLVGMNLIVLNRYRGLQVIDISNLDAPTLLGRAPISGRPKELYVRGANAYVISAGPDASVPQGFQSTLRVVDLSNPRVPHVVGAININGDAVDSRIVGNIMYVVSSRAPWHNRFQNTDTGPTTQILAIDVADPANVRVIDSKDFPRNGWDHHIAVTPKSIIIASSRNWGPGSGETHIRYVDISDPAGGIRIRGEAVVPGRVRDRWSMDEHDGALRVASGESWGNGDVHLQTFSVADPDAIIRLGGHILHVDERLTSTRFDGPNAYLVSYRNVDPLFHFDVSHPAAPRLVGELEMTGWLDFMVPSGDRIVALGCEDATGPDGERHISLAVSLVDVAPSGVPALLSRATIGEGWGWVPGERDDFAKVFKVLEPEGLIVFPFQSWSRTDHRYIGGVQLIDYNRSALTRRGLIQNAGWVERAIPHGAETVLTLSNEVFQVMDIRDRDHPRLRARVELARNVPDFAPLAATRAQLSCDARATRKAGN